MGAIVDTLIAGEDDIVTIKNTYPHATVVKLSNTGRANEKYRIIIPDVQDESYYFFLCDNCLATSSRNFLNRIVGDDMSKRIVKIRLATTLEAS